MKKLQANAILQSRYALAMVAGLLLAAAFPKIGFAGLAWVAPALMLVAAGGKTGAERFRIGYVAGLAHYLASLYWLLFIPYRWHGIPLGPAAGWLALSAYLALYPAIWVWLLSPVQNLPTPSALGQDRQEARPVPGKINSRLLPCSWIGRTLWTLSGAAAWVGLEMITARLFSGFPWNLLGASQYQLLPLIQIASVTGVYGVSFLVIWISLSMLSASLGLIQHPTRRSAWMAEIILPLIVLLAVFSFGLHQLKSGEPHDRTLKVTFVQPSIPQTLIWDETKDAERFGEIIRLSEQALANPTDLLIWPEAAVPRLLRWDEEIFRAVTALARNHHVWMIIGADDKEPRANGLDSAKWEYFNSSFLISPEGKLIERYRKRSLVIFGEYIPLEHSLPVLKYFTPIEGGFTPGDRAVQFDLRELGVKTSPLICFEDIFPHLAPDGCEDDTDFLVNLTNNGWFGESAAQWQHAASALFRAVENGLPLLRCSNNGLTCWVDAHGRLRQVFRDKTGSVYGPGFMNAEIPLPSPLRARTHPFYNRHGDWFGWSCVGFGGLTFFRRLNQRTRPEQPALST